MRMQRKLVSASSLWLASRAIQFTMTVSHRAELWHIFHDELDLDGNGHIDADELSSALSKAGAYPWNCCLIGISQ